METIMDPIMDRLDWVDIDKWIMGEAIIGSQLDRHLYEICERIGSRWAGTSGDLHAAEYIREQFESFGLVNPHLEGFDLDTWDYSHSSSRIVEDGLELTVQPMLNCPSIDLTAPLIDVGFGMPDLIEQLRGRLPGSIALVSEPFEPFSTQKPLPDRLTELANAGCAAAIAVDGRDGGRIEYLKATDKRRHERAGQVMPHPLPCVQTHKEDGIRLRRAASEGKSINIKIVSRSFVTPAFNAVAEIPGSTMPSEHAVLSAHIDTYPDSPGANDDGSGLVTTLEVARLFALMAKELGVNPGIGVRFCAYSGEEQNHQGSASYVQKHYGPETPPRFCLNLDELSAGSMKGMVVQMPHTQQVVQNALDDLNEGLQCYTMPLLEHMNDGFSFTRSAIPVILLWRWRFVGRNSASDFRAEAWDTPDKLPMGELKEYVAFIARTLLRLSHVPPSNWPANPETAPAIEDRLESELGTVARTM